MNSKIQLRAAAILTAAAVVSCGTNKEPAVANLDQKQSRTTQKKAALTPDKPNIVYIVIDDLGYSDLGCYGSTIKTPNIDTLARNGILFSDYYTQPLSSPSRAALLTGSDSNLVGMGLTADTELGDTVPNIRGIVDPAYGTIADTLKENGYETLAVGKWHLGMNGAFTPDGDKEHWPSGKGFTKNYGFVGNQTNQFQPGSLIEGDRFVETDFTREDYHFTADMVDKTLSYIDEAQNKPFFAYFATGAMHCPFQAPESYIRAYRGQFDGGWDIEREKRLERQISLGIFPKGTKLPDPNEGIRAWTTLNAEEKAVAARHMEVYAGFLTHTDEQIGRLFDGLKDRGLYDKTVFVLVSDNGATTNGGADGGAISHRPVNLVPYPASQQIAFLDNFGNRDFGSVYNSGWAMASSTPFRYNKQSTYNGGVRVPLIVSWKNGVVKPGRISREIVDSSDITPTMYEITGLTRLTEIDGLAQKPASGISFASALTSASPVKGRGKELCLVLGGSYVYSDGEYLIVNHPKTQKAAMYNVKNDPTQCKDLSTVMGEKFDELYSRFDSRRRELGAANIAQDIALGISPEIIIAEYGEPAREVFTSIKTAQPPQNPLAREIVTLLKAFNFDPGNGRKGIGMTIYRPSSSPLGKKEYRYTPDMGIFYPESAAPTQMVSHTITVSATAPSNPEGVLFARGGADGGYVLYVQNGKPVFEYNFAGEPYRLISSKPLPAGKTSIEYTYEKTGLHDGMGTLSVNGEKVAYGPMKNLPVFTSFDYVSFGQDAGSPVSKNYPSRFVWNGKITDVTIRIGDDLWESSSAQKTGEKP